MNRMMPAGVLAAVLMAAPACASSGAYTQYPTARVDDRAYALGYDEGRRRGENDARRNQRFDYSRHGEYRNADDRYRGYGDRYQFESLYRRGFANGYSDGYRRYARDGYGSGAYYPGTRYASPAADYGYREGYEQGREDARERDRYDPIRASAYREGDRHYDSRYGSREDYKREYRAAFQRGYSEGYRNARRS